MNNLPIDNTHQIPHSEEAERAVLGVILVNNEQFDDIAELLVEEDFYFPEHQHIFGAITLLVKNGKMCDTISVFEKLKDIGRASTDDSGGMQYLGELALVASNTQSVMHHATIVRERSMLRKMITAGNRITQNALAPGDRDTQMLLDQAEQTLFAIGDTHVRSAPRLAASFAADVVNQIDAFIKKGSGITGVSTGFATLDGYTTGLHSGDLVIVAGRPGMGKTSFAMNLIESVVLQSELAALVFSMEMSAQQLIMRMFSSLGKVDQQHLRNGKINDNEWGSISQVIQKLDYMQLYIDDSETLTPSEIRARARRLARQLPKDKKIGAIMIDYIQLMHSSNTHSSNNRVAEVSEITRQLKALAKEIQAPVIALSQLSRAVESRQEKRPTMSDLRESGSIEQDADLIMFIYRDDYYTKENSQTPGETEIIIAKQRNGPTGDVRLQFEHRYSRFKEATGIEPIPTNHHNAFSARIGDFG